MLQVRRPHGYSELVISGLLEKRAAVLGERSLELMTSHRRSAAPRPRIMLGADFPGRACAVLRGLANTLRMLVMLAPGRYAKSAIMQREVW